MRAALVAVLALVALLPVASAQVPSAPDPGQVIDAACAATSGAPVRLPVCPEPVAPAPADPNEEHEHAEGVPDAPATQQDAPALAQAAVEQAQGAAQDPASAPDRAAALVATIVQFVKDALGLPGAAGARLHAAALDVGHALERAAASVAHAGAKVGDAVGSAGDKASKVAGAVLTRVGELLHRDGAPAADAGSAARAPLSRAPPRDTLTRLLPGEVRDVVEHAR